jgi:tetratricopeptide (TPR) repeat protein
MKRDTNQGTRWLYARAGFLLLSIALFIGAARVPAQAQSQEPTQHRTDPGNEPLPEGNPELKEYNRLVKEGERLRDAGKFDAAIALFKQAYALDSTTAGDIYAILGEVYVRKGQMREAEKAYRLAFAGRNDPTRSTFYTNDPLHYARYALIEIHFQNWQETFLTYGIAHKLVHGEYKRENLPVFDTPVLDIMQKRELEAAVRMILLETIPKRAERLAEVEKILVLSPKLALAHYELADKLLSVKYPGDRAGYRKAAIPHYEAVVKYGVGDLREWAQRSLTSLQKEEQNSPPLFVPIPQ